MDSQLYQSARQGKERFIDRDQSMTPALLTGAEVQSLPDAYIALCRGDIERTLELFCLWTSGNDDGLGV